MSQQSLIAWLNLNSGAVQALCAIGILVLTAALVCATIWYARLTRRAVALTTQQFERDWSPDLRIADIQYSGSGLVNLRIANLAKPAALVRLLRIGTGGRVLQNIPPQDVMDFPLVLLVPGGQTHDDYSIHGEMGLYRTKYSPPPVPPGRSPWSAGLSVTLVYDCAGSEHQTPWFDFSADFLDLSVVRIQLQV
jgi:hypothetical protein